MALTADRVPYLMADLLDWLKCTKEHPLIVNCVLHYELEFIHPFADGNGRIGRLWQTLILQNWKPPLPYLPVETVIRDRQDGYYQALTEADQCADSTPFVELMLNALHNAIRESVSIDQVTDYVTDQVALLLKAIGGNEWAAPI